MDAVGQGERGVLVQLIGLDPDETVPLHRDLILAVRRLGRNASWGTRIIALKFVFNWAHVSAGEEFGTAKADYERAVARRMVEERAKDPKMSVAFAETIAEADEAIYTLKLTYLLAEQRERSMRKFLETLSSALDNHRTDRADLRAGDQAHAQGIGGGA